MGGFNLFEECIYTKSHGFIQCNGFFVISEVRFSVLEIHICFSQSQQNRGIWYGVIMCRVTLDNLNKKTWIHRSEK